MLLRFSSSPLHGVSVHLNRAERTARNVVRKIKLKVTSQAKKANLVVPKDEKNETKSMDKRGTFISPRVMHMSSIYECRHKQL